MLCCQNGNPAVTINISFNFSHLEGWEIATTWAIDCSIGATIGRLKAAPLRTFKAPT